MSSLSPHINTLMQKAKFEQDRLASDTYVETWLSPAVFNQFWEPDEKVPLRFHFDIDIID